MRALLLAIVITINPLQASAGDPLADVLQLLGQPQADVRRQLGKPDRSGDDFDSFFKSGLAVTYDEDLKAAKLSAGRFVSGDAFRGKVLGIGLGDTEAACTAAWGKPRGTEWADTAHKRTVWGFRGYVLEVDIWTKDGSSEAFGTYRAGTVRDIRVSREPDEAAKILATLNKYGLAQRKKDAPGKSVVDVSISGGGVRDAEFAEAMAAAAKCPHLESLMIYDAPMTDAGLKSLKLLAGLKRLKTLQIIGCPKVSDAGLKEAAGLPHLRDLYVTAVRLTDAGLKDLLALRDLRELGLSETRITDAGLQGLSALKDLRRLDLNRVAVTDAGLKELRGLSHLRELDLIATKVTDRGLQELAGLKELQRLNLVKTAVAGPGLKHLTGLSRLRYLNLGDTKVTDAAMKDVAALSKVESLDLEGTAVTEVGVRELSAMKGLRHLSLEYNRLTDGMIKELGALKQLESLGVGVKFLHWKQVEALRNALPKAHIH